MLLYIYAGQHRWMKCRGVCFCFWKRRVISKTLSVKQEHPTQCKDRKATPFCDETRLRHTKGGGNALRFKRSMGRYVRPRAGNKTNQKAWFQVIFSKLLTSNQHFPSFGVLLWSVMFNIWVKCFTLVVLMCWFRSGGADSLDVLCWRSWFGGN